MAPSHNSDLRRPSPDPQDPGQERLRRLPGARHHLDRHGHLLVVCDRPHHLRVLSQDSTQALHLLWLAFSGPDPIPRTRGGHPLQKKSPQKRSADLLKTAIHTRMVFYYKKILLLYCKASKICLSFTSSLPDKSAIVRETFKILKYTLVDNCKLSTALVKISLLFFDK